MLRPFKFFEERRNLVVIASSAQPQGARRHLERSSWLRLARLCQSQAEQMVDNRLEGFAAASDFLFKEHSDVVVDGKSCAHIMMLRWKAS